MKREGHAVPGLDVKAFEAGIGWLKLFRMPRFACWWLTISLCAADLRVIDVQKIWDAAPHNAFTDLAHFRGHWYCVFREASTHVSADGKLRIIRSRDGRRWASAALIEDSRGDLRDAKLAINQRGELMLVGAVAFQPPGRHRHQSLVWFSRDGLQWSPAQDVADADYWLWRATFSKGLALGIGYTTNLPASDRSIRLYESRDDGRTFQTLVDRLEVRDYPNESAIRFRRDGKAICLLRRDPGHGMVGTASPPYRQWTWRELDRRIGGPNLIEMPDGRWLAAVRLYEGKSTYTALAWLDVERATLTEFLKLPSGGDNSYPGLVVRNGELWVSYYSSHELRTSIYLARVQIPRR